MTIQRSVVLLHQRDFQTKVIMKILYHHRTLSRDGMDVHISEIIKALKAEGHQVTLVAPQFSSESFGEDGGWVQRVRSALPGFVSELLEFGYNVVAYRNLVRTIRRDRPDVIYERYALYLIAGVLVKWRFGIPLILEINSPLYEERRQHGGLSIKALARWSELFSWKHADYRLPVTKVLADIVAQSTGSSEKIAIIANGINPDQYSQSIEGGEVRARYGLEGKMILGFTGFVRPWHGLDKVIRLISELGDTGRRICLMIVGDGPARAGLESLADQLDVTQSLIFTGVVQRELVPEYVSSFDIALQPDATDYASPLKLIEYMALGKAILAPDQPNIRELLDPDVTAVLFDKGSPGGMRDALLRLIFDEQLREKIGFAAAQKVLDVPLTWRSNAQKIAALILKDAN